MRGLDILRDYTPLSKLRGYFSISNFVDTMLMVCECVIAFAIRMETSSRRPEYVVEMDRCCKLYALQHY